MKKTIEIIFLLALAVGWMICIFKLSGMDSTNSNGKSTGIISWLIEDTLDITNKYGITSSYPDELKIEHASRLLNAPLRKVVHASVYFVLALFIIVLLNIVLENKKYLTKVVVTAFICIIFAMSDEIHQTFVEGRTGQPLDVLIDSAGALIGLLFYTTYHVAYKIGYKKAEEE